MRTKEKNRMSLSLSTKEPSERKGRSCFMISTEMGRTFPRGCYDEGREAYVFSKPTDVFPLGLG